MIWGCPVSAGGGGEGKRAEKGAKPECPENPPIGRHFGPPEREGERGREGEGGGGEKKEEKKKEGKKEG